MVDSTNPRVIADNIRDLDARSLGTIAQVEALQIYDDAETDTGKKWIDGKTIYRKVVIISELSDGSATVAHGITDLDKVIALYGMAATDTNAYPVNYYTGSQNRTLCYIGSTNISFTMGSTISGNFTKAYVIIEYTKAPAGLLAPNPDDNRNIEPPEEPGEEIKQEEK